FSGCSAGEKKPTQKSRLFSRSPWASVASATVAAVAIANVRTLVATVATRAVASRAAAAVFARASQAHDNRAPINGHAVQSGDGCLGLFGGSHFHKAEALGLTGVSVHHDLGGGNVAKVGKVAFQAGIGNGVGQVAHVDLAAHGGAFLNHGAPSGCGGANRSPRRLGRVD